MSSVTETYNPLTLAANASGVVSANPCEIGGFVCTVAGSITLRSGITIGSTPVVNALPVAAGQFVRIPLGFGLGCFVELTGGAAGTLCWL